MRLCPHECRGLCRSAAIFFYSPYPPTAIVSLILAHAPHGGFSCLWYGMACPLPHLAHICVLVFSGVVIARLFTSDATRPPIDDVPVRNRFNTTLAVLGSTIAPTVPGPVSATMTASLELSGVFGRTEEELQVGSRWPCCFRLMRFLSRRPLVGLRRLGF